MGNAHPVTHPKETIRERRQEKAISAFIKTNNTAADYRNPHHVVRETKVLSVASTATPEVQGVLYFKVLEGRLGDNVIPLTKESERHADTFSLAPYVSIKVGNKVFETKVVENSNPVWNQQYHILLNSSMYEPIVLELMNMSSFTRFHKLGEARVTANKLVGDHEEHDVWLEIGRRPSKRTRKYGFRKPMLSVAELHILYRFKPMEAVVQDFWTNIANQYDFDHNGDIDPFELGCLLQSIGSILSDREIEDLLANGPIPINSLAEHMQRTKVQHLIKVTNCPVCGEHTTTPREVNVKHISTHKDKVTHATIQPSLIADLPVCRQDTEVIAHIGPCMELNGSDDLLIRNFLFDLVGISWWKERLPEWKAHVQYIRDNGNITLFDRQTNGWIEEKIPVFSKMAARALYSALPDHPENAKQFLCKLTQIVAPKYDDPISRKFISQFIHFYGINMDDVKDTVTSFKTFNEFFYRKVKPHARPIADVRNHRIAVMPADSRVVVYAQVSDCTNFWIKGEGFNLQSLLQDNELAKKFDNGSMVVCRLAPMDIHRFLSPATCMVGKTKRIEGTYFLDLPVIVRENVDVYTQNVRTVTLLRRTEFGDILCVAVGSTMVGSVEILPKEGDLIKKGDELGYFKFGGSSVILIFEKDKIIFADDIYDNSLKPVETYCWMGSPLGVVKSKI